MSENTHSGRYSLDQDGRLWWQKDATNPLPGIEAGQVKKGSGLYKPDLDVGADVDSAAAQAWLETYIKETLNPLPNFADFGEGTAPVRAICSRLYDTLGILPREDLEDLITKLDADDRRVLRQNKVRLGPVLVFMPSLNKPASVRLRALLIALWEDKSLPVENLPNDGMVSVRMSDEADHAMLRRIGYPVYAGRAIRVDMLDRLICAAYDSAEKGIFRARHDMAEWLGCPIPDLYAVLEAMGFVRIPSPETENPEKGADDKPLLDQFRLRPATKPKAVAAPKPKKQPCPPKQNKVPLQAHAKNDPADSPFAVLKDLKFNDGKGA